MNTVLNKIQTQAGDYGFTPEFKLKILSVISEKSCTDAYE